ncbi:MAG: Crp/Fnr family transcriptional regulator [Oscillospiraceae bacterium]|nr:Crp/Fnr family transcriptional regulator [Oscillospiraceae bacterium]
MEQYLFVLRNSSFFQGMTDGEILSVLHCVSGTTVKKEKDEYIFRMGDSTQLMGLVLKGSVLCIQEDLWGHRNILEHIGVGEYFAEPFAATPGAVLNVSVVAAEDTEIMLLNMHRLLQTCPSACAHHNKLIRNLVSVMARKVLNLNNKITHMGKRNTRQKILSYLSTESMKQGKLSFDIPYDRQQLADYLCVERAAMSVELSKLQKEGYLKTNRNHFQLMTLTET